MTQPPPGPWPPPPDPRGQGRAPVPTQPTWGPPTTQPLSDRNPYEPMGAAKPASVSIDQYAVKRSKAPWIIAGVVGVLLAGLFWMGSGADRFQNAAGNTAGTSAASGAPGPAVTGNGVEFHSSWDDADGVFEILESRWTSQGLELDVRISLAAGSSFTFGFFALDNTTTEEFSPVVSSENGLLDSGTVRSGDSVRGTVVFPKERGDTTVILADATDRQVTALSVEG